MATTLLAMLFGPAELHVSSADKNQAIATLNINPGRKNRHGARFDVVSYRGILYNEYLNARGKH
jgi:hypothetical protein